MRPESRSTAPALEVRKREQLRVGLRKQGAQSEDRTPEIPVRSSDDAQRLAAQLLDEALNDPKCAMTSDEVAYLLGVSRSLVDKWREADAPNSPSFIQLVRLPPAFHFALNRALDRRYGFGRAALSDLLVAAGSIAVSLDR